MADNAGERALSAATQLEKIGFVDFTVDLVKGVYEIIVKSSMDQLQSYADLVDKVSKSLTEYQAESIGADGSTELTEKVDSYIKDVLSLDPATTSDHSLTTEQGEFVKDHFSGTQIDDTSTSTPIRKSIADVLTVGAAGDYTLAASDLKLFVEAKLKAGVKHSQDILKTILKLGMQKVVVSNGDIQTKLTFHVDAQDMGSKESQSRSQKASGWGLGGGVSASTGFVGKLIGGAVGGSLSGGYSSRKLSVSVVNERSSSATNVQVDILGAVRIQFRTETFPSVDT